MSDRSFLDTNVLLYLLSDEQAKADCAEGLVAQGGVVSVQVLNEIAAVTIRKFGRSWSDVQAILAVGRDFCSVETLTLETHEKGMALAERYKLSVYDAMIVASALLAGSTTLYSED